MQQLALETIATAEAIGMGSEPLPDATADERAPSAGEAATLSKAGAAPKAKEKAGASSSSSLSSKRPPAEGAGMAPGKKAKKVKK